MLNLGQSHPTAGRRVAVVILALMCAGLLLSLVALLVAPVPAASATSASPAVVAFSLDRQQVSLPGQCTTLRWDVSGVREVYVDAARVVAGVAVQGTFETCPLWPVMHTLKIVLPDGASQTYSLFLDIVFWMPAFWLLLAGALLTGGVALRWSGRFSVPPILARAASGLRARAWARSLGYALLVLWIATIMFFWVMNNAPRVAATNELLKSLLAALKSIFLAPYLG